MQRYKRVRDRDGRELFVHRLRMEHKLGRKLTSRELVHHRNEDRYDNRLSNLRVVTARQHARLHHVSEQLSGENNHQAKLSIRQVRAIRRSRRSCRELGRLYSVSYTLISRIRNRVRWRHTL
jgi:hypothetical protein